MHTTSTPRAMPTSRTASATRAAATSTADTTTAASPERGQTTAEYALVLVGAATIAMLVVAWAGSTGRISDLLDTVLRSVTSLVA